MKYSASQFSTSREVQYTRESLVVADLGHLHQQVLGVVVRGGDELDPDQLLQAGGVQGGGGGEVSPAARSRASGRWPRGAAGPRTA